MSSNPKADAIHVATFFVSTRHQQRYWVDEGVNWARTQFLTFNRYHHSSYSYSSCPVPTKKLTQPLANLLPLQQITNAICGAKKLQSIPCRTIQCPTHTLPCALARVLAILWGEASYCKMSRLKHLDNWYRDTCEHRPRRSLDSSLPV